MVTSLAIVKNITFQVKVTVANIWVTLRKFSLLFISTSGHTAVPFAEILLWFGILYVLR